MYSRRTVHYFRSEIHFTITRLLTTNLVVVHASSVVLLELDYSRSANAILMPDKGYTRFILDLRDQGGIRTRMDPPQT